MIRVYTGDAFDLVGSRTRTDYRIDTSQKWCDETFEIKPRNRKEKEAVTIRVTEHLYRRVNREIAVTACPFVKTDSQAMEFRVQLSPGEETVITCRVHYSW
ncbi:MAG: hypothetical protein MUC65_04765 [Pontiellaceae bacterium]|nr:hypothetical protein [Pontiellaceae bacterium]